MKLSQAFKLLSAITVLSLSLSAFAVTGSNNPECAPELSAADSAIQELASTKEYKDSKVFQAQVERISKLNEGQKMKAYLDLADIKSDEETVAFLGSHNQTIPSKNVEALSIRAGLSNKQAEVLLKTVVNSIVGKRQE